MGAENLTMLGIGSSPGSLVAFILFGLSTNVARAKSRRLLLGVGI